MQRACDTPTYGAFVLSRQGSGTSSAPQSFTRSLLALPSRSSASVDPATASYGQERAWSADHEGLDHGLESEGQLKMLNVRICELQDDFLLSMEELQPFCKNSSKLDCLREIFDDLIEVFCSKADLHVTTLADYRKQLLRTSKYVECCEAEISQLREETNDLQSANLQLQRKLAQLESTHSELLSRLSATENQLSAQNLRAKKIRHELNALRDGLGTLKHDSVQILQNASRHSETNLQTMSHALFDIFGLYMNTFTTSSPKLQRDFSSLPRVPTLPHLPTELISLEWFAPYFKDQSPRRKSTKPVIMIEPIGSTDSTGEASEKASLKPPGQRLTVAISPGRPRRSLVQFPEPSDSYSDSPSSASLASPGRIDLTSSLSLSNSTPSPPLVNKPRTFSPRTPSISNTNARAALPSLQSPSRKSLLQVSDAPLWLKTDAAGTK